MLKSTNQMLMPIREPCRNGRKCHNLPTALLRPVRRWCGCGSSLLSSQRRSHEKGSILAVFLQLLARRLVHPSSSPAHDSTHTSRMGRVALMWEWKMTSLLPCFWSSMGSPCSPSAPLVLFSCATHGLWRKLFLELSCGYVSIRSFRSCLQVDQSLCRQQAVVNRRRCQPYFCWWKPLLNHSLCSSFA